MLSPEEIRSQVEKLTSDMITLSLCNHQNFPTVKALGRGRKEIGCANTESLSIALKNLPYRDIYNELERTQTYNLKMLDGALIQLMYRFKNDVIETHRLAFFPSPNLEEFQSNPEMYEDDVIYAEIVMKRNVAPFPIRFDFDSREEVCAELDHPKSHLTLGQYKHCRIPVSAPLTPYYFICFILRNFYNTVFQEYSGRISVFESGFEETIIGSEVDVVHIRIPQEGAFGATN